MKGPEGLMARSPFFFSSLRRPRAAPLAAAALAARALRAHGGTGLVALQLHRGAVLDAVAALGHDFLAGPDARDQRDHLDVRLAALHGAHRHRAVLVDHEDV